MVESEGTSRQRRFDEYVFVPQTHETQVSPMCIATNAFVVISRYFTETWLQVNTKRLLHEVSLPFCACALNSKTSDDLCFVFLGR